MIYRSTSLAEVIGRVIRNTRIQDSSYISDMGEWIPEAMGQMQTKFELVNRFKDLELDFHKAILPCGLIHIKQGGVEYNGCRIPHRRQSRTVRSYSNSAISNAPVATPQPFLSVPIERRTAVDVTIYDSTAIPLQTTCWEDCQFLPENTNLWYDIELDTLLMPVDTGVVRIHYRSIPMDEKGFPLIPDNESYKQALYWYTRGMMIGAGFKDTVYTAQYCMAEFDKFAARAKTQITYPSTDEMNARIPDITRFLPESDIMYNILLL